MARRRTQAKRVPSFFKVMYGEDFDKLMYIPPKVAPCLSELNGRKTYLEDSSGTKWEVSVSKVNGLLAFRQGWNEFFTGHGMEYGDFIVLNYMGAYFDVDVYNRSAIQRVKFQKSSQTKKSTPMDQQCSNPRTDRTELNDRTKLTNIRSMNSRKRNMESDEQGKKSKARRCHSRNDQSQLKRDNVYGKIGKRPRFQYQTESSRNDPSDSESDAVEIDEFEETLPEFKRTDGDNTESSSLCRGTEDRSEPERTAVERDDFEEMHQFERQNYEGPSLYCGSEVRSQSERNEEDDFDETPQYKTQNVDTEGGVREQGSSSCIKKVEIQPKREIFEDSFFGFAWEGARNTDNEARTAVHDLSEFELWGGCSTNQSAGTKAAAGRDGFGDKDQGTSSRDVRTNETSNYASGVAAKVEAAGEMFQNERNLVSPITTEKDKGHILSGDRPREPEPTETTTGPVSVAANNKGRVMFTYSKRVPPTVSGVAVPIIKKERVGGDTLPFNLTKNKPTAQGAAAPVIKNERMGADALPFNLMKNKATAQGTEKPTIAAKTEPKVETFTVLPLQPLRAVATNPSFLELPSELPGEIPHMGKSTNRIVILKDSVKRLWPVLYNNDTTRKVLHSEEWEGFCKANDLQLGDECVLQFKRNNLYAASVVKKQHIT